MKIEIQMYTVTADSELPTAGASSSTCYLDLEKAIGNFSGVSSAVSLAY